jgi:hypothetical protein
MKDIEDARELVAKIKRANRIRVRRFFQALKPDVRDARRKVGEILVNQGNQAVLVSQRQKSGPIQVGTDENADTLDMRSAEASAGTVEQKLHLWPNFVGAAYRHFCPADAGAAKLRGRIFELQMPPA